MRRHGVKLALGTDGSSCNDNLVLHEAMRALATAHRPSEPDRSRWISAGEVLRMATAGGDGALRQEKLGCIAPGYSADLAVYRLDAPWWVPVNDVVTQMVYSRDRQPPLRRVSLPGSARAYVRDPDRRPHSPCPPRHAQVYTMYLLPGGDA
jgi:cytosine/adenosine deaminase-related metal-dependent hydrolase